MHSWISFLSRSSTSPGARGTTMPGYPSLKHPEELQWLSTLDELPGFEVCSLLLLFTIWWDAAIVTLIYSQDYVILHCTNTTIVAIAGGHLGYSGHGAFMNNGAFYRVFWCFVLRQGLIMQFRLSWAQLVFQAGLTMILLPQLLGCWHYTWVPPHLALYSLVHTTFFFNELGCWHYDFICIFSFSIGYH